MAQLVVRNLEDDVKVRLQRRAKKHGCSLEELVRDILRDVENNRLRPVYHGGYTKPYRADPAPRRDILPRGGAAPRAGPRPGRVRGGRGGRAGGATRPPEANINVRLIAEAGHY